MQNGPSVSARSTAIVLALVAVGLFANTLANGFVFDDHDQIVDNPWIRDFRHAGDAFTSHVWAFAGKDSNYYRPLMTVAYTVVNAAFGASPIAFHAVNVLAHAGVTLLVFVLLRLLVVDETGLAVLVGALVFAAHPIHVESVAWISALPDVACAGFAVLGVIAFAASFCTRRSAAALHVAGAASVLAAMLFKEPGVVVPGIIVLLDLARRPRGHGASFWGGRYGSLAVASAIYLALRMHALGAAMPHDAGAHATTVEALRLAGVALWRYAAMLTFPYPLNAFQTLESAVPFPWWGSLIVATASIAIAVARGSVRWTAAAALASLPLLPAMYAPALLPGLDNPWAERYVYLASVGVSVAIATGIATLAPRWRWPVLGTSAIVLIVFSGMTVIRNTIWHDDLRLWSDTVAKSPRSGAAHASLGHALFTRGQIEDAIREYRLAIELKPDYGDAYLNLGVALATQGRHGDAVPLYMTTVALQPRSAIAHADLAISLSLLGRQADAYAAARRAVELRPALAKGHLALGMALGNSGDIAGAVRAFRRAAELDPTDEVNRRNLVTAEAMLAGAGR